MSRDRPSCLQHQSGASVDQSGIDLNHIGASVHFRDRIGPAHNTADTDDWKANTKRVSHCRDHAVAGLKNGGTTESAGFITVGQVFYSIARQRGVGGDQPVNPVGNSTRANGIDIRFFQIRCQLDEHRPLAISIGKSGTEELAVMVDTFRPLQVTQQALDIEDPGYLRSWLEPGM